MSLIVPSPSPSSHPSSPLCRRRASIDSASHPLLRPSHHNPDLPSHARRLSRRSASPRNSDEAVAPTPLHLASLPQTLPSIMPSSDMMAAAETLASVASAGPSTPPTSSFVISIATQELHRLVFSQHLGAKEANASRQRMRGLSRKEGAMPPLARRSRLPELPRLGQAVSLPRRRPRASSACSPLRSLRSAKRKCQNHSLQKGQTSPQHASPSTTLTMPPPAPNQPSAKSPPRTPNRPSQRKRMLHTNPLRLPPPGRRLIVFCPAKHKAKAVFRSFANPTNLAAPLPVPITNTPMQPTTSASSSSNIMASPSRTSHPNIARMHSSSSSRRRSETISTQNDFFDRDFASSAGPSTSSAMAYQKQRFDHPSMVRGAHRPVCTIPRCFLLWPSRRGRRCARCQPSLGRTFRLPPAPVSERRQRLFQSIRPLRHHVCSAQASSSAIRRPAHIAPQALGTRLTVSQTSKSTHRPHVARVLRPPLRFRFSAQVRGSRPTARGSQHALQRVWLSRSRCLRRASRRHREVAAQRCQPPWRRARRVCGPRDPRRPAAAKDRSALLPMVWHHCQHARLPKDQGRRPPGLGGARHRRARSGARGQPSLGQSAQLWLHHSRRRRQHRRYARQTLGRQRALPASSAHCEPWRAPLREQGLVLGHPRAL